MKDNEKKIKKEMKLEIFKTCSWRFGKPLDYKNITDDIAEDLYNLGYRKIPEDSVVLSREEWRKYVDNENEAYYRGQHEAEVYYKNIQIPRERKETVEKYTDKLLDFIHNETFRKGYELKKVERRIKELAKQFGVEIKE